MISHFKRKFPKRWIIIFDGITDSMDMSLSKLQEKANDTEAWHAAAQRIRVGHNLVTEQWTINFWLQHNKNLVNGLVSMQVLSTNQWIHMMWLVIMRRGFKGPRYPGMYHATPNMEPLRPSRRVIIFALWNSAILLSWFEKILSIIVTMATATSVADLAWRMFKEQHLIRQEWVPTWMQPGD